MRTDRASGKSPSMKKRRRPRIIPGFGLTMGLTMSYLGLIVLIPLSVLFFRSLSITGPEFWQMIASPRTLAAFRVSFVSSVSAASVNTVCGLTVAWVLVRYDFPGKAFLDAVVDLPFALPTAVAGISLATIYSRTGWIGKHLDTAGIQGAYSRLGIVIALIFVGFPFVVRTLQPVLKDLDPQMEEAAACLGATRVQTFFKVLLPVILPAALTGFALALARGLGEYGSVVFISGNMPMKTEIVPLLIMTKLEEYNYEGAIAIAAVMLFVSFLLMLAINILQAWSGRRTEVQ